jgi:hypothetical protein
MSNRDRSGQDRWVDEDEPQKDPRDAEGASGPSARRPRRPSSEEEIEELPTWPTQQSKSANRDQPERPATSGTRPATGSSQSGSGSHRAPIPQLGDAFRPSARSRPMEEIDHSPAATRDPYDRLRRVASKPQRPISYDDELVFDEFSEPGYGTPSYEEAPRVRPRRKPTAPPQERTYRPPATEQIGGMIAAAAPQTRFMAAIGGFSLISLVFMAATVAGRKSSLPDWMPIHLNAEGNPDLWGSPSTLWRIPLMVVMLSIMSGVVAWFVGKSDPFAARFTVGSLILIHALSWIALIGLAW